MGYFVWLFELKELRTENYRKRCGMLAVLDVFSRQVQILLCSILALVISSPFPYIAL